MPGRTRPQFIPTLEVMNDESDEMLHGPISSRLNRVLAACAARPRGCTHDDVRLLSTDIEGVHFDSFVCLRRGEYGDSR
jgi:hypothetical protein